MRVRAFCAAAFAALVLAACGGGDGDDFSTGVRRVALSLAFSDETKAQPVEPERIVQLIPAPEEFELTSPVTTVVPGTRLRPRVPFACPTAPEQTPVTDIVSYGIKSTPRPGLYPRHNKGSLEILGAFPLKLPFPPFSKWAISEGAKVEPPALQDDPLAPAGGVDNWSQRPPGEDEGAPMFDYQVRKTFTPDFEVIDSLRLTSRRLLLLKRETVAGAETFTFTPSPAITVLEHADGEGHAWRSAGVDTETGQAMVIEASVERREPVDVCGKVFDSYRVVMTERVVNLRTGETSGTDEADPNVYNVATQLGGLILREDLHYTQTINAGGVPTPVVWDYVSTIDTTEPATAPTLGG